MHKIKDNLILNESSQAVMNNQPLFGCGEAQIQGYISVELYKQRSSSVVQGKAPVDGQILFQGETLSSGKPFVITELVVAIGDVRTTT